MFTLFQKCGRKPDGRKFSILFYTSPMPRKVRQTGPISSVPQPEPPVRAVVVAGQPPNVLSPEAPPSGSPPIDAPASILEAPPSGSPRIDAPASILRSTTRILQLTKIACVAGRSPARANSLSAVSRISSRRRIEETDWKCHRQTRQRLPA